MGMLSKSGALHSLASQAFDAVRDSLGFTPGRVVRVFGMRRSGNHAVINWICRNAETDDTVFLNNCMTGKSPLAGFRSIEVNGKRLPTESARSDLRKACTSIVDGGLLVVSYEDTSPGQIRSTQQKFQPFPCTDMIVYRSFLNWLASLLKKLQANPNYSVSRRAAVMLRAIDTYARLLAEIETTEDGQFVGVCYDDWLSSEGYRSRKLEQLGFPVLDNSLGELQTYGGGSSFQKDAASVLDLNANSRWQDMVRDPDYADILRLVSRDKRLIAPLTRVFPEDASRLIELTGEPQ